MALMQRKRKTSDKPNQRVAPKPRPQLPDPVVQNDLVEAIETAGALQDEIEQMEATEIGQKLKAARKDLGVLLKDIKEDLVDETPGDQHNMVAGPEFRAVLEPGGKKREITDMAGLVEFLENEGTDVYALLHIALGEVDKYVSAAKRKRFITEDPHGGARKFKIERARG